MAREAGANGRATIDCDVHCAPASREELFPYLSEYWREYVDGAGVRLTGMPGAYPPHAPTSGGAVPAAYESLRESLLGSMRRFRS